MTTRLDLMRKHWEEHAVLKGKGISGTDKEIGREVALGGMLVEMDWDTKGILRQQEFSCPSGIAVWGDMLAIASMRQNEICLFDKNWHLIRTLSHLAFNTLHSLAVTREDTLLVTSTGVDGLLEFNKEGTLLWQWFAFEHGYELDQYGKKRFLDMQGIIDHRKIDHPTLHQTTHINSVMQHRSEDDVLLATLFHQGTLVAIDKKTGVSTALVSGLSNPHSIRKSGNGYMVSDTKKGEIILLDKDFDVYDSFQTGSSWLQDATLLSNGNVLAAKSAENTLIEMDGKTKEISSVFSYDTNWRIYHVEELFS